MSTACISIAVIALALPGAEAPSEDILPGASIDYGKLAFSPERWKEKKVSFDMVPWEGRRVVFLTAKDKGDLDPAVVTRFVRRIDDGWKLYADLTGRSPRPFKVLGEKPVIAAIPDAGLSCGLGCGYIGATGIELGWFYDHDYPMIAKDPKAYAHYVFYEMGRNYYTFGDRHSLFITGWAVFMRYVCMDSLGCVDPERDTRAAIEKAEEVYSKTKDLGFLKAFTTLDGWDEKRDRLEGLSPSDQPVLYASAMLKLHRDCGRNEWLKRFHAALADCPKVKAESKPDGLRQSLAWYVAASVAARRDLAPVFCDRWKLPLSEKARKAAAAVPWSKEGLKAAEALAAIPADFAP